MPKTKEPSHLTNKRQIGSGKKLDDLLATMTQVAEGVWTSRAAQALGRKHGVETPIIDEVCAVLYENRNPKEAVRNLMTRSPKSEDDLM